MKNREELSALLKNCIVAGDNLFFSEVTGAELYIIADEILKERKRDDLKRRLQHLKSEELSECLKIIPILIKQEVLDGKKGK